MKTLLSCLLIWFTLTCFYYPKFETCFCTYDRGLTWIPCHKIPQSEFKIAEDGWIDLSFRKATPDEFKQYRDK